jgi:hypothetical protein
MKFKTLLTFAAALALGFTVAHAADDDTPLAAEMKAMNKSLRTLKKQAADASKKEENLGLVAKMKKNIEAAAKLNPITTKDVPAADKAAFLAKYKDQMASVSKSIDDLEVAIKADKTDDAKKIFEKMSDEKEKGHKDFTKEDDK